MEEFSFTAQSVGRLASGLFILLRDGRPAPLDDEALLDELAAVELVESSPGVLRPGHDRGRHDDQTIAPALAAHYLLDRPTAVRSHMVPIWEADLPMSEDTGRIVDDEWDITHRVWRGGPSTFSHETPSR